MFTVHIGSAEAPIAEASEGWINQQINRRRADHAPVCVQVAIATTELRMRLSTPQCAGGPNGRGPTPQELRVFRLWEECGLNRADFTGGNVVAFLHRVEKYL